MFSISLLSIYLMTQLGVIYYDSIYYSETIKLSVNTKIMRNLPLNYYYTLHADIDIT